MTSTQQDIKTCTVTSGFTYSYTYIPAKASSPTFLLLHGFPSAAHDWRKTIADLSSKGYGVLAPDLLGYAGTDKPAAVEEYAGSKMSAHIAEILDHEKLGQVIGVGHDWGSALLSRVCTFHPQYFSSLVFMAVPYLLPQPMDLDAMNAMTKEVFGYEFGGYWYFFAAPEAAELISQNVESFLSIIYQSDPEMLKSDFCPVGKLKEWVASGKTAPLPAWMPRSEFEEHCKILSQGGFTGPLNWYKAATQQVDKEAEQRIALDTLLISKPVLFVAGETDPVGRPEVAFDAAKQGREKGYLPNVEVEVVKGSGHWMLLEKPQEVLEILDKVAKKL